MAIVVLRGVMDGLAWGAARKDKGEGSSYVKLRTP